MAHKKAGGSSRNGRDSNPNRLGVKRFDVRTNIRGASITDEIALLALQMNGEPADIDAAIAHLNDLGVHVEQLDP